MLLIIIKGNFDKNVRAAIFVSVISVLNLLVYLLFLTANGFAHGEKTKKKFVAKMGKGTQMLSNYLLCYAGGFHLAVFLHLCFLLLNRTVKTGKGEKVNEKRTNILSAIVFS